VGNVLPLVLTLDMAASGFGCCHPMAISLGRIRLADYEYILLLGNLSTVKMDNTNT
jgi:hypothetical protein